jgi:2OG-Fe(II) oxygenase superfamily
MTGTASALMQVGDANRPCSTHDTPPASDNAVPGGASPYSDSKQQEELLNNLRYYGWSLVSIDVDRVVDRLSGSPLSSNMDITTAYEKSEPWYHCLKEIHAWRDQFVDLFIQDNVIGSESSPHSGVIYRASAESGDPNTVEPKQSWEVKREASYADGDTLHKSTSQVFRRMQNWCQVLHHTASSIRQAIQLPSDTFLLEKKGHGDVSSQEPLDLLRAFYYETVPEEASNKESSVLGSSPHTDWGSFTIVWQDSVGGLQTFCHACQAWVDVPANKVEHGGDEKRVLQLVVHVGDVTSLAIHAALQMKVHESDHRPLQDQQAHLNGSNGSFSKQDISKASIPFHTATDEAHSPTTESLREVNDDTAHPSASDSTNKKQEHEIQHSRVIVPWPSPLHRVRSPTGSTRRASLVYFAYPPAQLSVHDIAQSLLHSNWPELGCLDWGDYKYESSLQTPEANECHDKVSSLPILQLLPFSDYYLLRNQAPPEHSASSGDQDASAPTDNELSSYDGLPSRSYSQARDQWTAVEHTPLMKVLTEKWQQVQR